MYVELHLHTSFSFLDGASQPEELVGRARDLGYGALAATDHDGLHGAMEFARHAVDAGIQPITGAELTLLDGSHLTLLCESVAGYGNLCRLITEAHRLRQGGREEGGGGTSGAGGRDESRGHGGLGHGGDSADRDHGSPRRAPLPPSVENRSSWSGEAPTVASDEGAIVGGMDSSRIGSEFGQKPMGHHRTGWPSDQGALLGLPHPRARESSALQGASSPQPGAFSPGRPRQRTASEANDPGQHPPSRRPALPFALRNVGVSRPQQRTEPVDPRLDPALLATSAEGLILLTGCRQGQLSRLVDADRPGEAEALLRRYVAWLGRENVVVELQRNLVHGDTRRVARLVALAERVGVRYAATGNVHYAVPERSRLQDVLVAIRHRTTLDNCHRERRPNAEFHLRSPEEMAALFADHPDAIETTALIAERCRGFDLTRDLAYRFPDYPSRHGETADEALRQVCLAEMAARYPAEEHGVATTRLDEELRVIGGHKLAGFFLLYRDLLEMAREVAEEVRGAGTGRRLGNLPPGRGRGSSVSSIVCYLIGLSHVDPLKHNLLFGRFLNDELHSIPDIDLDFPREIRERLIERVYERYGQERAALVCAFSTYKLRSAVRDVGKALGIPQVDLDKIAKLSDRHGVDRLGDELALLPEYADRLSSPPWTHLVELAGQLAHFPRHVTQHVGGMIVSSTPLCELVPIQPAAMEGRYLCQWDKDSCDDARMVKIDFLALGMLSLVEECLDLVVANGKAPIDLSRIDLDDRLIYDMICAGDTIGVFQIESRAQIQMLPRTQPRRLEDLIVQVAIVRPGPIIGGAVKPYVAHRQTSRTSFLPVLPHYDHPVLEPVLRETHGVVLYQEQVLEVAMALAGFTAGQADALRRSMTRRRSREAMFRLWEQFKAGAAKRDIDEATARTVFDKLLGFAAYGFPKAHAAAFAVLAYQSCWLKYYHPTEFLCALLNNQPMGFYPAHVLTNDAKRHGVRMLPPDINLSGVRCTVEGGNGIRVGFGYVRALGADAARRIVTEREANGPYRSLADVTRRTPLSTEAMENLIAVGTFDRFGLGRREALWQLGLFVSSKRFGVGRGEGEGDRGRQLALALPIEQDMVPLRPMAPWDQLQADYAVIGLSPRYHPLGLLRTKLPAHYATTATLEELAEGTGVQIAGLIVCRQRPGTAKGIQFLLLEDELGLVNVVVHPWLYDERRAVIRSEPFLVISGELQRRGGVLNIVASDATALEDARRQYGSPAAMERSTIKPRRRTLDDAQRPAPDRVDAIEAPFRTSAVQPESRGGEDPLAVIAPRSHDYR